jgi:hypothetical protein
MPQIFRVSLVKMVHAKFPRSKTPEPFMELRAFIFLKNLPTTPFVASNLRNSLDDAIKEMVDNLLSHIFQNNMGSFDFVPSGTVTSPISMKQKTRFYRVEIDGLEVEPIDVDELRDNFFKEDLAWNIRGFRTRFTHNLFTEKRQDRVLKQRRWEQMDLITGRIYRYMAFYDEDGNIKGEYDEGDIRTMLTEIDLVSQRNAIIRRMFSSTADLLEQASVEIDKSISDLEGLSKRFKP